MYHQCLHSLLIRYSLKYFVTCYSSATKMSVSSHYGCLVILCNVSKCFIADPCDTCQDSLVTVYALRAVIVPIGSRMGKLRDVQPALTSSTCDSEQGSQIRLPSADTSHIKSITMGHLILLKKDTLSKKCC
jgi:hypothetical protein